MAALALAAMLFAAPREGAAGPYLFPDQPPGPSLGEPDEPSSPAPRGWARAWLPFGRIASWLQSRDL